MLVITAFWLSWQRISLNRIKFSIHTSSRPVRTRYHHTVHLGSYYGMHCATSLLWPNRHSSSLQSYHCPCHTWKRASHCYKYRMFVLMYYLWKTYLTILLSYFRDEWNISLKCLKYLFVRKSGSQIHWFFNIIILQSITHDCITWKYNNFVNNMTYKYLSLFSKPRIKYCVFLFLNRNIAPVPLAKGYFELKK